MDKILIRKIVMKDNTLEDKVIEKKTWFKKEVEIRKDVAVTTITQYNLYYRVDEDRFWYEKLINDKVIDEHHTKNGYQKSMEILDGIYNRLQMFKNENCVIEDTIMIEPEIEEKLLYLQREDYDKPRKVEGVFFKK